MRDAVLPVTVVKRETEVKSLIKKLNHLRGQYLKNPAIYRYEPSAWRCFLKRYSPATHWARATFFVGLVMVAFQSAVRQWSMTTKAGIAVFIFGALLVALIAEHWYDDDTLWVSASKRDLRKLQKKVEAAEEDLGLYQARENNREAIRALKPKIKALGGKITMLNDHEISIEIHGWVYESDLSEASYEDVACFISQR